MMHTAVLKKCTKCDKSFSGPTQMSKHMQTHGEKLHECKLCYTKFTLNGYLRQHSRKTHKEDQDWLTREIREEDLQFHCSEDDCDKKFVTQKILDWHKNYGHTHVKLNCNFCAEEFSSPLMLRTHCKKAHTKKTFTSKADFQCKLCYKSFTKKGNFVAHKYVHKGDRAAFERKLTDSDLIFECKEEHCGKRFISEDILKYHRNDNHRQLEFKYLKNPTGRDQKCPLCYINFKSFYTMHNHILEAHKDDKDLLRAGTKMADPQFVCKKCDKKFVRPSILKYHQNRIHRLHLNPNIKEKECKLCYKLFNNARNLKSHTKIHKKDKAAFSREICDSDLKFECKEEGCEMKFISENILKYHYRSVHGEGVFLEFRHLKQEGQKVHTCPLCFIKYKSFHNMHRHLTERHKEEKELLKSDGGLPEPKYKCSDCDKSFVTMSLLQFHTDRIHKNKTIETKVAERWACNYCPEIFSTCSLVKAHSLAEHKKKYQCLDPNLLKFECVLCKNRFMKYKYMKNHQDSVHKKDREFLAIGITDDDLIHQCNLCELKLVSETSLTLHSERIHRRKRPIKTIKKKKNQKMKTKKGGLPNNISPSYKCDFCDQEFDVHQILRRHSKKVHNERTSVISNQEKRFKCKLCYHQFDFKCNLEQHQKGVHRGELHLMDSPSDEGDLKFNCENCEKKFLSQNSKDFHRRFQHKDEYRKLSSIKSDTGEKRPNEKSSFSCILCYNKFNYKGDLKKHVNKFHTTEEEVTALQNGSVDESKLKFNCDSCEKRFLNGTILLYHQRYIHRAARGSVSQGGGTFCKLCYVRFQKSRNLINHKAKVHQDEMAGFSIKLEESELKHSCDQCNRKFWTVNILSHHIRTRHKALPSKETSCILCQVNFKLPDYQRKHVQNRHKTEDELEAINMGANVVLEIPCDHCDKKVYSNRTLVIHKNRVHSTDLPRDLNCRLCQVEFKDIYKQRAHVGNVHKGKEEMDAIKEGADVILTTPCDHCEKQLFSRKTLDYHIRSVHKEEFNKLKQGTFCKLCYIRFEKSNSLSSHKAKVHIDEMDGFNVKIEDSQLNYSCDQCKRRFWTENILNHHTRTRHTVLLPKETYCRLCQVEFSCPKNQRVHLRNVHKSKEEVEAIKEGPDVLLNIPCQHCQKYVYSGKCLKLHMSSSHKSNLPKDVICRLCQVEFKSVFRQKVHVGNMHKTKAEHEAIKVGENMKTDITCNHCGKGVYSARTLSYHMQKLHNEASKVDQTCEVCQKVFKWDYTIKKKMSQHMEKDHGKKPKAAKTKKTLLNSQYMYMMSVLNGKK